MRPLLELIETGAIDPSFVITHRLPLEEAAHGYNIFAHKIDNCIKVVLKPEWDGNGLNGPVKDDNYTVLH